ncbi:hypothetical protein DZC73_07955 [Albitalea terrae]|uniref:Uncharacterized protein n=1 Tax=Piscinibacter terrae TaxID=2496871 RepID=A0A3N7HT17_9BURK|nr:hypothetical protein DZC73_07955 [Albitalea terrae]
MAGGGDREGSQAGGSQGIDQAGGRSRRGRGTGQGAEEDGGQKEGRRQASAMTDAGCRIKR